MGQGKTKQEVLYIVKRIVEKKHGEKEEEFFHSVVKVGGKVS